jgi:hypothetical protein
MAPTAKEKETVDAWANQKLPAGAEILNLGVNRVIYQAPPRLEYALPGRNLLHERIATFVRTLPSVRWLFGELYMLSPFAFAAVLALQVVIHLQPTVRLYLNHRVLSMVRLTFCSMMDLR